MRFLNGIFKHLATWGLCFALLVHQTDMALLQWVAWLGMVTEYSIEEGSFAKGAQKTFNGKNACGLCCVIDELEETASSDGPGQRTPKPIQKEVSSQFIDPGHPCLLGVTTPMAKGVEGRFFPRHKNLRSQFLLSPSVPPPRVMS